LIYQDSKYDKGVKPMVDVINAFLHGLDRPLMLWLLSQGPTYGYELIKEVKRLTGRKLKPGIVYPLLYRLEDEGFVMGKWVKRGRRELKFYRLTEKGKGLLLKVHELFSKPIREVIADLLSEQKEK
jgi:PadR family transcriptional regulator PadR